MALSMKEYVNYRYKNYKNSLMDHSSIMWCVVYYMLTKVTPLKIFSTIEEDCSYIEGQMHGYRIVLLPLESKVLVYHDQHEDKTIDNLDDLITFCYLIK